MENANIKERTNILYIYMYIIIILQKELSVSSFNTRSCRVWLAHLSARS